MSALLLPAMVAVFVWWFGTGVVMRLAGGKRAPRTRIMVIATTLLPLALLAAAWSVTESSLTSVYTGFVAAIAIWGWVELAFLGGWITGPRPSACPPEARSWTRVRFALGAILYHEIALLVLGVALLAMAQNGSNGIAAQTYALLWVLRLAAKLNLFLGVRVPNAGLLPPRMLYLASYFSPTSGSPLLLPTLMASIFGAVLFAAAAVAQDAQSPVATALALLATLAALGALEHIFMMVPLPLAALWGREAVTQPPMVGEAAAERTVP